MEARDLKAYVERGWATAETRKQEHWAREFREHGSEVTFEVALALHEHMRLVNSDWPSEANRRDDLAHHVVLKRAIDGAARVFLLRAAR